MKIQNKRKTKIDNEYMQNKTVVLGNLFGVVKHSSSEVIAIIIPLLFNILHCLLLDSVLTLLYSVRGIAIINMPNQVRFANRCSGVFMI